MCPTATEWRRRDSSHHNLCSNGLTSFATSPQHLEVEAIFTSHFSSTKSGPTDLISQLSKGCGRHFLKAEVCLRANTWGHLTAFWEVTLVLTHLQQTSSALWHKTKHNPEHMPLVPSLCTGTASPSESRRKEISASRRMKQEDCHKFEVSLGYIMKSMAAWAQVKLSLKK